MKTEFLRKEHWHQGEHCTFAKFTGDDGTELFADFESETKVRVWGRALIDGHQVDVEGSGLQSDGSFTDFKISAVEPVPPRFDNEGTDLESWTEQVCKAIANRMFSDRYQLYRKQQMAFEHLKDVCQEMGQLETWKAKFLAEVTEATELLEKLGDQEEIALVP